MFWKQQIINMLQVFQDCYLLVRTNFKKSKLNTMILLYCSYYNDKGCVRIRIELACLICMYIMSLVSSHDEVDDRQIIFMYIKCFNIFCFAFKCVCGNFVHLPLWKMYTYDGNDTTYAYNKVYIFKYSYWKKNMT
jgi:hypothetical protein